MDRLALSSRHMPAAVLSADSGGAATTAPLAPPLKWAGGKRWQVPILEPLWRPHAHRRLVEPFCGGLAVALGLRPERALLNDVNPHLIAFYRWLQRGLRIDLPLENDETLYYAHRVRFNALLASRRRGRRRSGRPVLLPEPHRLQRPVPLQPRRPLQRPVRHLRADPLPARFLGVSRRPGAVGVHARRHRVDSLRRQRFRLRRSALRRALHALRARRVLVGRPGACRDPPGGARRAGRARQPGDAAGRRSLRRARLRAALSGRAAPHLVHGRPHPGLAKSSPRGISERPRQRVADAVASGAGTSWSTAA